MRNNFFEEAEIILLGENKEKSGLLVIVIGPICYAGVFKNAPAGTKIQSWKGGLQIFFVNENWKNMCLLYKEET